MWRAAAEGASPRMPGAQPAVLVQVKTVVSMLFKNSTPAAVMAEWHFYMSTAGLAQGDKSVPGGVRSPHVAGCSRSLWVLCCSSRGGKIGWTDSLPDGVWQGSGGVVLSMLQVGR